MYRILKLSSIARISRCTYNVFMNIQQFTVMHFSTKNNDNLPNLTDEQLERIQHRDAALRSQHLKLEFNMDPAMRDSVVRKRMIYRSKQRGWLEVDLLMGSWAVENIPTLTTEELDQYEIILNEETVNVFNYITGKQELPEHLDKLPLMHKLKSYALIKNMSSPQKYKFVKESANLT